MSLIPEVEHGSQFSHVCLRLGLLLEEQPVERKNGFQGSQILHPIDYSIGRICEIFSLNARNLQGRLSCKIRLKSKDKEHGDALVLTPQVEKLNPQEQLLAYEEVFKLLLKGWKKIPAHEVPTTGWIGLQIGSKYKEYATFSKTQELLEEEILIRFMADKFQVRDAVETDCDALTRTVYLALHAKSLSLFKEKLGFPGRYTGL